MHSNSYLPKNKEADSVEVRRHRYDDENGNLAFERVKYSCGAWEFEIPNDRLEYETTGQAFHKRLEDGDRKVPYRYPELQTVDKSRPVLFTEGEKDADTAIEKLGQQATCSYSPLSHWSVDWKLDGVDCVVIRDTDQPGLNGGLSRAEKLVEAGARRVRILDFTQLAWKGDLSDWAVGKTKADFEELLEKNAFLFFDSALPEGEQYPLMPIWGLADFDAKKHRSVCVFESVDAAIRARQRAELPSSFRSFFDKYLPVATNGKDPARNDFGALSELKLKPEAPVYVWTRNDAGGRGLVPKIAKEIRHRTYAVMPDDHKFGEGWHLSMDKPIPASLFKDGDSGRYYKGPSPQEMAKPASWLTDLKQVEDEPKKDGTPKTKTVCFLRWHVRDEWKFLVQDGLFVHDDLPDHALTPELFDSVFAAYCDRPASKLLAKANTDRLMREGYRPGVTQRRIDFNGQLRWNTWDATPDEVARRPAANTVQPFIDFMTYLVPDDTERFHLIRWAATLVAQPERKMLMGVLLKSHAQGVGKGIFTNLILARMIGWKNVSYPTEQVILEKYGSWWHKKQLAIVSEIHAGNSWKAYEILKSYVTEPVMEFRRMYSDPFPAENWCHPIITANGDLPLLMSDQDRRWLVVSATEEPWNEEKFAAFIAWLEAGGVSAIREWFLKIEDHSIEVNGQLKSFSYFSAGARAPKTETKSAIIEDSKSPAQKLLERLILSAAFEDPDADERIARAKPVVLWDTVLVEWLQSHFAAKGGKCYVSASDVRAAAKSWGMKVLERTTYKGRKMYPILNDAAVKESDCDLKWVKGQIPLELKAPDDSDDTMNVNALASGGFYPPGSDLPF